MLWLKSSLGHDFTHDIICYFWTFYLAKGCVTLDEIIKAGEKSTDSTKVDIDVMNDLCCLPYSSGTTGLPKGMSFDRKRALVKYQSQCEVIF